MTASPPSSRTFFDLSAYQWTVLFAAWLGWGFDIFDGILFNFVAPNCIPTLLGIAHGTPAAKSATLEWTGIVNSLLLVGWGLGGIAFGRITDRIGRTKTLLWTMVLFSLGTAACAFAPKVKCKNNLWPPSLHSFMAILATQRLVTVGANPPPLSVETPPVNMIT